jgi:uncharacterized protein YigE (DUF2233 family)
MLVLIISFSSGCKSQVENRLDSTYPSTIPLILEDLCIEASHGDSIRKVNKLLRSKLLLLKSKTDSTSFHRTDSLNICLSANLLTMQQIDSNLIKLKTLLKLDLKSINGSYQLRFKGIDYQLYVHNDPNLKLRVHHADSANKPYRSINRVKRNLIAKGLNPVLITNAGMYTPKNDPEGLFIEEYEEKFNIDTDSSEILLNFYMHPNGVYFLDSMNRPYVCSTTEYLELSADSSFRPRIATQSGPMLKVHGNIHHRFDWGSTSRKLRSGVGVYEGMSVFVITRGRSNFYDFASFFTEVFECENALFLDGEISKMYDKELSPNEMGGNFGPIISISSDKSRDK